MESDSVLGKGLSQSEQFGYRSSILGSDLNLGKDRSQFEKVSDHILVLESDRIFVLGAILVSGKGQCTARSEGAIAVLEKRRSG